MGEAKGASSHLQCADKAFEDEFVPCCRKYGIDIVVHNLSAGGVLSQKYKNKEVPAEGRYSEMDPHIGGVCR